MRVVFLLTLVLSFHSTSGFADNVDQCNGLGSGIGVMPTNTEMWAEQAQYFSNVLAANHLKSFCEWNRMDRASRSASLLEGTKYQEQYRLSNLAADKDSAAKAISEYRGIGGIWDRSMLGNPILKNQEYSGSNLARRMEYENARKEILEGRKKTIADFTAPISTQALFIIPDYDGMKISNYSPGSLERMAACKQFVGVLSVYSCVEALGEVEEYVKIRKKNVDIAGVESLKKTQTKEYAEGLRRAVNNVYAHFQEQPISGEANVFDDLKNGFKSAGVSEEKAEDMAFESLAAISTGGPHFYLRTSNRDEVSISLKQSKNYSATALQAIATGIVDLDTLKMQSKKPSLYSVPPQVKFPCDSGKYYHFWLVAYLTRKLVKRGYDPEVARVAPFIAHLGYQMRSTASRKASNQLTTKRYGATENGVRIDMSLASMGTAFGADSAQGKSRILNGEKGFSEFLKSGGLQPSLTGDEAESWFTTKQMDAAFRFMDNLNPQFVFEQYE